MKLENNKIKDGGQTARASLTSYNQNMKLNKKTLNAVSAKNHAVSKVVKAVKPGKVAKVINAAKTVKKAVKAKVSQAVALLTGERGFAARLVEVNTRPDSVHIRALQDNKGLAMRNGTFAEVKGGKLVGDKQARVELGGYVNGRNTGARVELITPEQFKARSKQAVIHWASDDNGIRGAYVGNPNVKGMCAVSVEYRGATYFWQIEQDSNPNNKHERGAIKPLKANGKLEIAK